MGEKRLAKFMGNKYRRKKYEEKWKCSNKGGNNKIKQKMKSRTNTIVQKKKKNWERKKRKNKKNKKMK